MSGGRRGAVGGALPGRGEALTEAAVDELGEHLQRAVQHLRAQRPAEAEADCRLAVEHDPGDAGAHRLLGDVLESQGRLAEAAEAYQQALQVEPGNVDTCNNLGLVWYALGRVEDAAACFTQVIEHDPAHVQAHSNLGLVWRDLGRSDEAVASCRRALELAAGHPVVHNNLALALEDEGLLAEAVANYRQALRLDPSNAAIHSNLLLALNYDPEVSPADLLAEHRRWDQTHGRVAEPVQPHANTPDPDRRLRLGYVSPDFRSHPAVYFFEPLLAGHDRRKFEVVGYGNVAAPDGVTDRLRDRCDDFVNVWGMTDEQFAAKVRADGVDILVDLAGHTGRNRLTAFAHRPAPVQISYLGYQHHTGMAAMDYRITDDITDPAPAPGTPGTPGSGSSTTGAPGGQTPAVDASSTTGERMLRLPGGFLCFHPSPNAPEVTLLPALTNGHVTFIASHRLIKVNEQVLDLWARVLEAIPTARLVLAPRSLSPGAMRRLTDALVQRGVAAERFEFQHRYLTGVPYLATFGQADLMLDAFPTCAGTTACEALWMGVPLITLRGRRYAGRMAASILTRVGLEQFIVETAEQYVDLATRWSQRLSDLAALRAGMRDRLLGSPLCDAGRFVSELEGAYRQAWRRWCQATDWPQP